MPKEMFFDDKKLCKIHGNWVRTQVAFYDFIFIKGSKMCANCFKDKAIQEISNGFCDGGDIYEKTIKAIKQIFPTFKSAQVAFLSEIGGGDE